MLYDEKNIIKVTKKFLSKIDFTKELKKKDKIHGIDIQRMSKIGCRYWFIEAKGLPSKTYKKGKKLGKKKSQQTIGAQKYSWFITAIGQIALRMKQKHGKYGIAFPYDKYFHDKILDKNKSKNKERQTYLKLFRKRTRLHFFLVYNKNKIYHLTPTAKKFKMEKL